MPEITLDYIQTIIPRLTDEVKDSGIKMETSYTSILKDNKNSFITDSKSLFEGEVILEKAEDKLKESRILLK